MTRDGTRATNQLYALQKSCDCPILSMTITRSATGGVWSTSLRYLFLEWLLLVECK